MALYIPIHLWRRTSRVYQLPSVPKRMFFLLRLTLFLLLCLYIEGLVSLPWQTVIACQTVLLQWFFLCHVVHSSC